MTKEKDAPSGLYAKLAAVFVALSGMQIQKDQTLGEVSYVSDTEIKSKVDPLLSEHRILTFSKVTPCGIQEGGLFQNGKVMGVTVEITFMDADSKEKETVSCFHEKWEGAPFGATITMAEKYLYKTMFRIALADDHAVNVSKYRAEAEAKLKELEGKKTTMPAPEKTTEPAPGKKEEKKNDDVPLVNTTAPVVVNTDQVDTKKETMDETLKRLTGKDQGKKEAPPVKETPVAVVTESKTESVIDPSAEDFLSSINEGWVVKAVKATDKDKAIKELHDAYLAVTDKIYIHEDYAKIGINIDEVLKLRGVRKSNAKFREYIIEYRLFGRDAMLEKMANECKLSVEDLLVKVGAKEAPKGKTVNDYKEQVDNPKFHPDIKDETPLVAVEKTDVPAGAKINQDANIEIPPLVEGPTGLSRGIAGFSSCFNQLRVIGIGENEIKFALGESDLSEKYNVEQQGIVMTFLSTAPDVDIKYMIDFCKREIKQ